MAADLKRIAKSLGSVSGLHYARIQLNIWQIKKLNMKSTRRLSFAVSDRIGGKEISPDAVPLGLIAEFIADVRKFIKGSQKEIKEKDLVIQIKYGSLEFATDEMPGNLNIFSDLALLSRGTFDLVDSERVMITKKWHAYSIQNPSRTVRFGDSSGVSVSVNANSVFTSANADSWVRVERYFIGTLEDWGGGTAPNIHLRLNDGKVSVIGATKEQLRNEEENLLYQVVGVRVELEENINTLEQRNLSLISLNKNSPVFDEAEFERATTRGKIAWKAVDDPVDWIRKQRGEFR